MAIDSVHRSVHRIETPFGGFGIVYLYLLKGDRIALVDTGTADSPREVLEPALAEIGLRLSEVDLILTTHAHHDHAGGNHETRRASGAPIYLHSADLPMAESPEAEIEFHTAPMRALDYPAEVIRQRTNDVLSMARHPAGADVVLTGGETVDLGAGILLRVVHTPGHSPGHVSYYWESEGVLFTGDAVQGRGPMAGVYPYYFSAPDYRRTLAVLSRLEARVLCLGHAFHGGGLVNNPTRKGADVGGFLQESLRVADTIHGAVTLALRQRPTAGKPELARAALSELIYHIPQLLVRETGMPKLAGPALLSHLQSALDGSYPTGV